MTSAQTQTARQPALHLYIDPNPYASRMHRPPESRSPPSSARSVLTTASLLSTTICSVLCMHDFDSDDPDHLRFRRNEILDIVRREPSGWWAAIKRDGDDEKVGWIPQAFVRPLSDQMAERLRNTPEELRDYEYEAELLYSAPTQMIHDILDHPLPLPESATSTIRRTTSAEAYRAQSGSKALLRSRPSPESGNSSDPSSQRSRIRRPSTPSTSSSQPSSSTSSSTTPSIRPSKSFSPQVEDRRRLQPLPHPERSRGQGLCNTNVSRIQTTIEAGTISANYRVTPASSAGSSDPLIKSRSFQAKCKQSPVNDGNAIALKTPPRAPWYLQPIHGNELQIDADGRVRSGTLAALVEKLTCQPPTTDPTKKAEDTSYKRTFLVTFRTFTTADQLFDMLVEHYRMNPPESLTDAEFEEWKQHLFITQEQILNVFTMWLEEHRLLEEEPHVAQRLTDFLQLIVSPPRLATTAKLIIQHIERLTFTTTDDSPTSNRRVRRSRAHRNELLKLDAMDVAEQLSLIEHKRYAKITPQDCIRHATGSRLQEGGSLAKFCSTHDKLASWVKVSVLDNNALGKRATTIDFWIRVAENCRNLNNFSSMSAIITALSSAVISRLHLTWAHVNRKSTLDSLLRHNEPSGGFAGYRNLMNHVEGPCVPFITMYLTDIVHVHDQYMDEDERICFAQRQRYFEIISAILNFQSRVYDIGESESTMNFIWKHLNELQDKDQSWFWARSQEVQHTELAHTDIRKGLERAGF